MSVYFKLENCTFTAVVEYKVLFFLIANGLALAVEGDEVRKVDLGMRKGIEVASNHDPQLTLVNWA